MVTILQSCKHCGRDIYKAGFCHCPDSQLEAIDIERAELILRLAELGEREREVLVLVPSSTALKAGERKDG